ncbi:MAG: hypothetical protein ABI682_17365 [Acidobacteriota bacterium]
MKHTVTLTITSLLSILFATFHLTDDIVRGMSPGRLSNLPVVLVLAVWLYATLMLAERQSGSVVILVMSLLASGLPVIHMMGAGGVTGGMKYGGAFFFAWTLLALGVTAICSVILSARGLMAFARERPRPGPELRKNEKSLE